jgi:hypothetical protein
MPLDIMRDAMVFEGQRVVLFRCGAIDGDVARVCRLIFPPKKRRWQLFFEKFAKNTCQTRRWLLRDAEAPLHTLGHGASPHH